ncbi:hypothetical protein [Moritella viscosa]|uniref:hypothetical protein n=1 Tax=Moritella viscosa TaxID=80854 RepID=UPI001587735E|nr:hypothetical protein [Moritella viscosa]
MNVRDSVLQLTHLGIEIKRQVVQWSSRLAISIMLFVSRRIADKDIIDTGYYTVISKY